MKTLRRLLFLYLFLPLLGHAALFVGVGKADITPPVGSPSAGYNERKGEGMAGVHDPLLALALFIDNGEKKLVLCSVDHLGFTYEMVQEITRRVHQFPATEKCELFIASTHTHSGGGAFLNIPFLGAALAGAYNPKVTEFYIQRTIDAIQEAASHPVPAKIGIGYGKAGALSSFRSTYPKDAAPLSDIAVFKITKEDDSPFAVLFNYPVHPTVLPAKNRLFSADFVGYSRTSLQTLLGSQVQPIYFNGAQGDIAPVIFEEQDRFASCAELGHSLAKSVKAIWNHITVSDTLHIATEKTTYSFVPQATPQGLSLPIKQYPTEMNLIVLNHTHAFLTIPGELSCVYDKELKKQSKQLGYQHLSIFGLTNDAHGYIILPEAWRRKTFESGMSFGGENYGEDTKERALSLLKTHKELSN